MAPVLLPLLLLLVSLPGLAAAPFPEVFNTEPTPGGPMPAEEAARSMELPSGFGGVYALCAPHLLFIPDANGDDVPDSAPEILLDGFNSKTIGHNITNGLRWGPDGWLYGRHGITDTSAIGAPGTPADQRTRMNCGIFRWHPQSHVFEVVCQGGTNSWGHDWNSHGELFWINTVIGHLFHGIPAICASCHKLYGDGAALGPDLTGSDRHNLDYLLGNIIDPNAMVPADYRVTVLQLKDGRTLTGVLPEQTERTLTVQTPAERLVVERSQIVSQEQQLVSLMPEGLLSALGEENVRHLFAYLMSRAQVAPPQ